MKAQRFRSDGRVLSVISLGMFCCLATVVCASEQWAGDVDYHTPDETFTTLSIDSAFNDHAYLRDIGRYETSSVADLQARIKCLCQEMKTSGIAYNGDVVQFYQGVAEGGIEQEFEYGGKVDQFLTLDSGKLGL